MFDIKWIRENPDAFDAGLARRGAEPHAAKLIELDAQSRALQTEWQQAQARRNEASKSIGKAKAQGDEAQAQALMVEVAKLKEDMPQIEERQKEAATALKDLLSSLPNLPMGDVPEGADETDNVEVKSWGEKREFNFAPLEHDALGAKLGMDFEGAAALSGSRFVVLKGGLARLERALGQYMLDVQTRDQGYLEVAPPVLVRDDALFGTGQLPKFSEDLFKTTGDHWLIPTAEVVLTNLVREQILDLEDLPLRFTALTNCFRSEAGAAGKDTRGMIRQHQFNKVELVSITTLDQADEELERKTRAAEVILENLGLPYRRMILCAGDMGFAAQKTYDLEVWLPGQGRYREISSCSNCGDFQARRMMTRARPKGEKQTQFVATLNGSGLAVGRTLIAVMENYQQADGSITVPEVLRPYMGGIETITAEF
ncbi:MAG: serine--tRNA ligase [Sphingomonadales bacterium]|jgi:seryl-tRNA synthetase